MVNIFGKIRHKLPRRCVDKLFTFCVKDILMSIRFGQGKSRNENGKQCPLISIERLSYSKANCLLGSSRIAVVAFYC